MSHGYVTLPGRCVLSYTRAWQGGRRCLSQLGFVGLVSMCVIIQQMGLVNRCWRQLCFLTQALCLPGKEPARLCREEYRLGQAADGFLLHPLNF